MDRRDALRTLGGASAAFLAGCSTGTAGDDVTEIEVTAVDVLNRRSTAESIEFVGTHDDDVVVKRTRRIAGTDDSSHPTGVEFAEWPDERRGYEFRLSVDDGKTLRTTPSELGVDGAGTDCVRVVFVANLDERLTAHARTPCTRD